MRRGAEKVDAVLGANRDVPADDGNADDGDDDDKCNKYAF